MGPSTVSLYLSLLSICSVNTHPYNSRPAASALQNSVSEAPKLNETHGRISALSLMGGRFSFLTETGKNINTGGGGSGKAARARAPGPGSRKGGRMLGLPRPGSQSQLAGVRQTGDARGLSEGTPGATAKAPGCGITHRKLRKPDHKLSLAWGQRRTGQVKLRGLRGSECDIRGTQDRVGNPPSPRESVPFFRGGIGRGRPTPVPFLPGSDTVQRGHS